MKHLALIGAAALLAVVVAMMVIIWVGNTSSSKAVTSFEECVAAGSAVMESYPRQCASGGQTFVEVIAEVPDDEDVSVELPDTPVEGGEGDTPAEPPVAAGECYVGGCSSQLCTDKPDMVSTCEWREVYACYQEATCERQADGQCGFTETAELAQCVAEAQ